jgi:lipid-binding SYLF domain-containing protein
MKTQMSKVAVAMAALAMGRAAAADATSDEKTAAVTEHRVERTASRRELVSEAEATVASFRSTDPGLSRFFDGAAGYVVFPTVGKGGAIVGGAYGKGVLFEHCNPIGRATLTQVTVGAQLGGQSYSEIVFLESEEALARFKRGQFSVAAQASAVAAAAGRSANARYARGVAVFTLAETGLMAEASVGGQKFGFRPFAKTM